MGFLPNGDLIVVLLDNKLKDYKIYLYPFKIKPTANTTLWEYSQIYDIEIPESLKDLKIEFRFNPIKCLVHQTKLFFLFYQKLMVQWNLLTMTLDMHYFFNRERYTTDIVINKNQTLLALSLKVKTVVFSMETGTLVSSSYAKG